MSISVINQSKTPQKAHNANDDYCLPLREMQLFTMDCFECESGHSDRSHICKYLQTKQLNAEAVQRFEWSCMSCINNKYHKSIFHFNIEFIHVPHTSNELQ